MTAARDHCCYTGTTMLFAGVGDVHGHMHAMVAHLRAWEARHERTIEFVLQVGDFEPHRDADDVATMAAPSKYRQLGEFHEFFTGAATMPWPVYFIGGNHEPYGLLDHHIDGGPIAANVHYLGRAGSTSIRDMTVVGLSGIFREDYFERRRPAVQDIFSRSNKDYIYFTSRDVDRALDCDAADILVVHEWPSGIIAPEDEHEFENQRRSMRYDAVGNDYARLLMDLLQPRLVLCGHMHKRYRRTIELAPGRTVDVACLANVAQGADSIAIFEVIGDSDDRRMVELTDGT